jgi:hypothetical protein
MENRMHGVTERRQRGRPKGSTRYAQQDATVLRQAADLMVRDGKLSPTAAIKLATGKPSDDTLIHRLRGKMKPNLEQHLAEARARAEQDRRNSVAQAPASAWNPAGIVTTVAQVSAFMHSPAMREAMHTAAEMAKRVHAFELSPQVQETMRTIAERARAFELSPQVKEIMRAMAGAAKWANPPTIDVSLLAHRAIR